MTKLARFLNNSDLIKGRKAAPVGKKSPDGKTVKAADGKWKPVKRQSTKTQTKEITTTPSKGGDYAGIDPQYHKYVDKVKEHLERSKNNVKNMPTSERKYWQSELVRARESVPKVIEMSRKLTVELAKEKAKSTATLKQHKLKVGDKVRVQVGSNLMLGPQFGIGTVKINKDGVVYFAVGSDQSPDGKSKRLSFNNPWEKAKATAKPIKQKDPVPADARLALNWVKKEFDKIASVKDVVKFDTDANGNITVRQGRLKQLVATQGKSYTEMKKQLVNTAMFLVQIRMQEKKRK